jgi:DNA modification methylase
VPQNGVECHEKVVIDGPVEIIQGDCLEVMRGMADASVDAVVTDPPYLRVGGASASSISRATFSTTPQERQFFDLWMREVWREWSRILKPTGAMFLTIDWRGAHSCEAAANGTPLAFGGVGVWDKEQFGMGHMLRHSYECFVVARMPDWERRTASERDVWTIKWSSRNSAYGHDAEKPVALMERAVTLLTSAGDLVLDPFTGTGTTGEACARLRRRFIGIEREAEYVAVARRRLYGLQPELEPAA